MTYIESDAADDLTKGHPIPDETIGRFGIRLKEAMKGISARSFSRDCGLSEGAIRSYLSGETYPTLDRLLQIAVAAGVDPVWLGFGDTGLTAGPIGSDSTYAFIPLYDARISQGHGAWNEGAKVLTQLAFARNSLRRKGLEPSQLAAVRVDGDSNEPVLSDGDTVMMDLRRNTLQGEAFYVIRLDHLLYAKRLQRQIDGGIQVLSANPAYSPMMVKPDQLDSLEVIGRVVWAGGWMI